MVEAGKAPLCKAVSRAVATWEKPSRHAVTRHFMLKASLVSFVCYRRISLPWLA